LIKAKVVNEGTEPLTHVALVATTSNDASLTIAQFPGQGCSIRQRRVTCRLSRLEPGAKHSFLMEGKARRVGLEPESINLPLRAQLSVSAAEHLLPYYRKSQELTFALARCTNRDRGAGDIHGSNFADKICGRRGADYIFPGEGSDVVKAGDGNDVIVAEDGRAYRDQISCGRGRDRVIADRRDRVSHDCERVRRLRGY
jgi:Ca2+-binding RTX toxin-like protein